jgi:hypothetical protein
VLLLPFFFLVTIQNGPLVDKLKVSGSEEEGAERIITKGKKKKIFKEEEERKRAKITVMVAI